MTRRRRIFDIDLPKEAPDAAEAPVDRERRGPMATALRETAETLRERQDIEAGIRAENDALAHDYVRLRREGLVIQLAPVELVDATKLARDRASDRDPELAELKASILALGLSNPIRVEPTSDGRFELIQGWRRLRAFRELEAEHGDGRFARIPACHAPVSDALETSYRRMVDENLVRKDVSFAEMARLAQRYAADPAVACDDVDEAVAALFRSAGYQKRSYIRAFAALLDGLGDSLAHPEALSRNLGLDLRRALDRTPGFAQALRARLAVAPDRTAEDETVILRDALAALDAAQSAAAAGTAAGPGGAARDGAAVEDAAPGTLRRASQPPSARALSLVLKTRAGLMRCVASDGRLILRGAALSGAVSAERLEAALSAFLDALAEDDGMQA
jgi:ParB family chromosome partitioning protein